MQIIKKFRVTCPVSAAADAFAEHLVGYDEEHVRGVMSSKAAIRQEVIWWHDYEVQTEHENEDGVFAHRDVDPNELADKVVELYKGWKWRDACEYGQELMIRVPDEVFPPGYGEWSSERIRKVRKGELEIATILTIGGVDQLV